jgi:curved DNA-binding protein CbpA
MKYQIHNVVHSFCQPIFAQFQNFDFVYHMTIQSALKWLEIPQIDSLNLEILKKNYHHLARKYHPDRGGKADDFIAFREAYTFLQEYLINPNKEKFRHQETPPYTQSKTSSNIPNFDEISQELASYKRAYNDSKNLAQNYEKMINLQIKIISQFQENSTQITGAYKTYADNLRAILDEEVAKLKKQYGGTIWGNLIGRKNMTEAEYYTSYNQLVDEYNKLRQKANDDYTANLINEQQNLINQIIELINNV